MSLPLLYAALIATATATYPTNVGELYTAMAVLPAPTLGVLAAGNFDSVNHMLPSTVTAVVFTTSSELEQAVTNGSVSAGLVSGQPSATVDLAAFSSTSISPRAMFTQRGGDQTIRDAFDAAIARALHNGAAEDAARANPPFEFVAVHTCLTSNVSRFPWPDLGGRTAPFKIASLGPYDWNNDGNYTAIPPTGFWPEFEARVAAELLVGTGLGYERVWAASSAATMLLVENGTADATAPYWTVDAYYGDRSRQRQFETGCTTIGYDSTFFVATHVSSAAGSLSVSDGVPVLIPILLGAAVILCVGFVLYLRKREVRGQPLFGSDV